MIPTLIFPPEAAGAEPVEAGAEPPHATRLSAITDAQRVANTFFIIIIPPRIVFDVRTIPYLLSILGGFYKFSIK
jgi:hypothetical protein